MECIPWLIKKKQKKNNAVFKRVVEDQCRSQDIVYLYWVTWCLGCWVTGAWTRD